MAGENDGFQRLLGIRGGLQSFCIALLVEVFQVWKGIVDDYEPIVVCGLLSWIGCSILRVLLEQDMSDPNAQRHSLLYCWCASLATTTFMLIVTFSIRSNVFGLGMFGCSLLLRGSVVRHEGTSGRFYGGSEYD